MFNYIRKRSHPAHAFDAMETGEAIPMQQFFSSPHSGSSLQTSQHTEPSPCCSKTLPRDQLRPNSENVVHAVYHRPHLLANSPLTGLNHFAIKASGLRSHTTLESNETQVFSTCLHVYAAQQMRHYKMFFLDNRGKVFMSAEQNDEGTLVVSGDTLLGVLQPLPLRSLFGAMWTNNWVYCYGELTFERKDLDVCSRMLYWILCSCGLFCPDYCTRCSMIYEIRSNGEIVGQIRSNSKAGVQVKIDVYVHNRQRAVIAVAAYTLFNAFWQRVSLIQQNQVVVYKS